MASVQKPKKRACSKCGKPNAVIPARLCPTCKRLNKKASSANSYAKHVEATYGLSVENYNKLLKASNGRCFICGGKSGRIRLAVDHDHTKTGKESVRGLLCKKCNHYLLGKIGHDNPDILEAILVNAIAYLRNPPAQRILNDDEVVE